MDIQAVSLLLQALAVEVVLLLASCASFTSSRASPTLATAKTYTSVLRCNSYTWKLKGSPLSPVCLNGAGRCGGGGCGWPSGGSGAGSSGTRSSGAAATESRADVAKLDVGVSNRRTGGLGLDNRGRARCGGTSTTSDTGLGRIRSCGVVGVEPQHVDSVVIPEGEDEDHSATHSGTHCGHATLVLEARGIAEGSLCLVTVGASDGVEGVHSGNVDLGVLDDVAILNVETADLAKSAAGGVVAGKELGDNGELAAGVNGHALAVVSRVAHAERVEITTIRITNSAVSAGRTASSARATGEAIALARVGSEGSRHGVGFPDIHLIAAGTKITCSAVDISGRGLPANGVGLWGLINKAATLTVNRLKRTTPLMNLISRGHWESQ